MLLREPYYTENIGRDQPYLSMLLIAPHCQFKCKGCQNKHLANNKLKNFSVNELTKLYNDNPFFQGITIGGLEIFDSGSEFISEFIELISFGKIEKITIYTRRKIEDDKVQTLLNKLKKIKTLKNIYLKTGEFIYKNKNENTVHLDNWSIKLYNKEQDFIKIK